MFGKCTILTKNVLQNFGAIFNLKKEKKIKAMMTSCEVLSSTHVKNNSCDAVVVVVVAVVVVACVGPSHENCAKCCQRMDR